MKTRPTDAEPKSGLPPPLAPTARDANPWRMSAPPAVASKLAREPKLPHELPRRRKRGASPDLSRVTPAHLRRIPWIPLLILVFIAGTGVQLAIRALRAGDVEAAIGALVMVAFVAFMVLRRIRKSSR